MRSSSLSVLAIAAALPTFAVAQDSIRLDQVVVSGGLSPIVQSEYGRAASVITADDLERRGITSVQDALRAVPGVAVNGSGRSYTQVRIRGGEGNHTLVLIDGIEAVGGGDEYGFSGLDAADIERIEVLRGPQSVYFGSNASSGVINIITKKATGNGYGGKVEFGNGHLANIWTQTRGAAGGLRLSMTDSYDKGVDESGEGGERDFIDRQTLRLNGDLKLSDALSLTTTMSAAREKYAYDSQSYAATDAASSVLDTVDAFSWRRESILGFGARYGEAGSRFSHAVDYARTTSKSRYSENGDWTRGTTDSYKYRAEIGLDGGLDVARHSLNAMVERQEDKNNSAPDYARDMNSYAVEYRGNFDNGFAMQAGLRYDDNKVFDDFIGWTLAASYQLNDAVRLHGSAGRASVNPSYFELYANADYGTSIYLGNPDLKPEQNTSFDFGIETSFAQGRGVVDVTVFHENLKDEIESYNAGRNPSGVVEYRHRNQWGNSRRQGVEIGGKWEATDQLSLGVSYSYTDAKNPNGSREVRRPFHELGLQANWRSADQKLSLTADLRHVSGNYDTQYFGAYKVAELPAFSVLNLAASYALNDQVALSGRVLNVFDKDYSDVWGYQAQDRAVWVGLSANF